ncbi:malectin [Halomicroarcula sp. S1AR25-4]|uniref:malectin domain-containing carbohydrate-binding protein n=1 Tax=Haloarcula sp. S1AR25-4 TaxID=2950538 RepID=UPI0028740F02|nr:malectin domain-containing carbohydrate-binding protein [Halomicroarcula sp. S1AR25-4]MDS0276765.1 malectin [Halomicroarcula sp. S1AR25-4]
MDTDDDGKNELVFEKTDTDLDPASNFSFPTITLDEDDEIESLEWDSYPYTITDIVVKAGPDCENVLDGQEMSGSVTPSNGKAIGNIRFCATAPVIRPLYQANAGGGFTASNGDQWDPLTDYLVAGGNNTSSHGQPSSIDSSVPSGTPSQIWETERWDPGSGDEMQYEFPVPEGEQAEVRLYFYDGYGGTSFVGDRVFDISVEDQTVENFDIIEAYGDQTGAMKSFTVTSDGTIDVDFTHVVENPQINAIEILPLES